MLLLSLSLFCGVSECCTLVLPLPMVPSPTHVLCAVLCCAVFQVVAASSRLCARVVQASKQLPGAGTAAIVDGG